MAKRISGTRRTDGMLMVVYRCFCGAEEEIIYGQAPEPCRMAAEEADYRRATKK